MQDHVLESIITTGKIEKEFVVLGNKVVLKTLSAEDFWDIMKETSGYDNITQYVGIKIKTLSRSIVSLNGKKVEYVPQDDNDAATPIKTIRQNEEIIGKWQTKTVDMFFLKYEELGEEQRDFLSQSRTSSEKHGAGTNGK